MDSNRPLASRFDHQGSRFVRRLEKMAEDSKQGRRKGGRISLIRVEWTRIVCGLDDSTNLKIDLRDTSHITQECEQGG